LGLDVEESIVEDVFGTSSFISFSDIKDIWFSLCRSSSSDQKEPVLDILHSFMAAVCSGTASGNFAYAQLM
jgi:hypothetical protein